MTRNSLTDHAVAIAAAAVELDRRIDAAAAAVQAAPCPENMDSERWEMLSLHAVDQLLVGAYNACAWATPMAMNPLLQLARASGVNPPPATPLAVRAEALRHAARALDRQLTDVMLDLGDVCSRGSDRYTREQRAHIDGLMDDLVPNDIWQRADAAADALAAFAAQLETEEARH